MGNNNPRVVDVDTTTATRRQQRLRQRLPPLSPRLLLLLCIVVVGMTSSHVRVAESLSPPTRSAANTPVRPSNSNTNTNSNKRHRPNESVHLPSLDDPCLSVSVSTPSFAASTSIQMPRRTAVSQITATGALLLLGASVPASVSLLPLPSLAYTPDPDPLQESLYFISRVQEATVQQERFIRKLGGTSELRAKLKLTLRLVDKNYKLLDQINFASASVTPPDKLVEASEAGYEAADALQTAIDFVKNDANWSGPNSDGPEACAERAAVLTKAMTECRERLLVFTEFVPADKLRNARLRVEDENVRNRDEFDGDDDAGVYNPVNLPWTPILTATEVATARKKQQ